MQEKNKNNSLFYKHIPLNAATYGFALSSDGIPDFDYLDFLILLIGD